MKVVCTYQIFLELTCTTHTVLVHEKNFQKPMPVRYMYYLCRLDDVLWINFSAAILNETFWSPNLKTCFSFSLRCPQDLHQARPFWCGWVENGQNGQKWMGKCKCCVHPRAKLKHVLWSGDLNASLRIAPKKLIHKASSNVCM